VVVPLYVLAPVNVNVPLLVLLNAPVPLITPDKVRLACVSNVPPLVLSVTARAEVKAAVERESAAGIAQVRIAGYGKRAAVDRRAAGVGVRAAKHQCAEIGFLHATRADQCGIDGGRHACTGCGAITHADDVRRTAQGQRVAGDGVTIHGELHA
jgi:hypothetical protein